MICARCYFLSHWHPSLTPSKKNPGPATDFCSGCKNETNSHHLSNCSISVIDCFSDGYRECLLAWWPPGGCLHADASKTILLHSKYGFQNMTFFLFLFDNQIMAFSQWFEASSYSMVWKILHNSCRLVFNEVNMILPFFFWKCKYDPSLFLDYKSWGITFYLCKLMISSVWEMILIICSNFRNLFMPLFIWRIWVPSSLVLKFTKWKVDYAINSSTQVYSGSYWSTSVTKLNFGGYTQRSVSNTEKMKAFLFLVQRVIGSLLVVSST